jgi:hypothetical protein
VSRDEKVAFLQQLVRKADEIAQGANSAGVSGPVNWADIGCVAATFELDNTGKEAVCVLIEEAAPDAYDLATYIEDQLALAGYYDVVVRTEW